MGMYNADPTRVSTSVVCLDQTERQPRPAKLLNCDSGKGNEITNGLCSALHLTSLSTGDYL
jgi:hypothetical protein